MAIWTSRLLARAEGITALQMDIKISGISPKMMAEALSQAREARMAIMKEMLSVIDAPRSELKPHAPRIITVKIPIDKIGALIGPGGKNIRSLQEETGTKIDVQEDGTVYIASTEGTGAKVAQERVEALGESAVVGNIYTGKVVRIADFGVFVEILPGVDGLVHISQLDTERVNKVEDVVKMGEEITVMVTDIDPQGKIRLSRQAVLEGLDRGRGQGTGSAAPKRGIPERPARRAEAAVIVIGAAEIDLAEPGPDQTCRRSRAASSFLTRRHRPSVAMFFRNLRASMGEYPRQFWLMITGVVLSTAGASMIWPFLLIYATNRLQLPLSVVAPLISINAGTGLLSSLIAGAMADRIGRKTVMNLSLTINGLGYFFLMSAATYQQFVVLMIVIGFAQPLYQVGADAMLADLIPPEKRTRAYAISRIAVNAAFAMGPAVGGFLASRSYHLAFYGATGGFLAYSLLLLLLARETLVRVPIGHPASVSPALSADAGYCARLPRQALLAVCRAHRTGPDRPNPALDPATDLRQGQLRAPGKSIWVDSDDQRADVRLSPIPSDRNHPTLQGAQRDCGRHARVCDRGRQRCVDDGLLGLLAEYGDSYSWRIGPRADIEQVRGRPGASRPARSIHEHLLAVLGSGTDPGPAHWRHTERSVGRTSHLVWWVDFGGAEHHRAVCARSPSPGPRPYRGRGLAGLWRGVKGVYSPKMLSSLCLTPGHSRSRML